MSQITILLLYLLSAVAFALSRLPKYAAWTRPFVLVAVAFGLAGLLLHGQLLFADFQRSSGLSVSLAGAVSLIGLQLALIGLLGAIEASLRGMTAGLLLLAAITVLPINLQPGIESASGLTWQMQVHILIAMFAYGLLTAGAIVAIFALIQNRRLRAGKLSSVNHLFAPLETTEKMLFGVASAGFAFLLLAVLSGFAFVSDLFAQHLVHKTAFSLLALVLFGILVAGRVFAGWRGKRAVYLYLSGFAFLCLAYFGARYVLEVVLNRSWS